MSTPRKRAQARAAARKLAPLPPHPCSAELLPPELVHWFRDPNFTTALASFAIGLLDATEVANIIRGNPQDPNAGLRWLTHALRDAVSIPQPSHLEPLVGLLKPPPPFKEGDRVRIPFGQNARGLSGILYVKECVLTGPNPEKLIDWTVSLVGKNGVRGCGYYNASLFELVKRPSQTREAGR
jgi:hypothetical protein